MSTASGGINTFKKVLFIFKQKGVNLIKNFIKFHDTRAAFQEYQAVNLIFNKEQYHVIDEHQRCLYGGS